MVVFTDNGATIIRIFIVELNVFIFTAFSVLLWLLVVYDWFQQGPLVTTRLSIEIADFQSTPLVASIRI